MPDIEDIIENLAPFAFVLIWILSAVFGRAKEQAPAKTTRPVFDPPRAPEPRMAGNAPTPAAIEGRASVDWQTLDGDNPYAGPEFQPAARPAEPGETAQEKMQKALRERALRNERKRRAAEAAAARKQAGGMTASPNQGPKNKPVDLSHLVSDHAAETHLERALADRPPAFAAPVRKSSTAMAALVANINDRDSVRKAMIMSIVLGEPKSKANAPKRP